MVELARRYRAVHVDVGTGDGLFVQRQARRRPDHLVVGVDASAERLRETSRRLAAKPSRGGLANARLGVLALEQAPGALAGLADRVTVLLPWGSLLRAVACADAAGLAGLRGVCAADAELRVVFGHGVADRSVVRELGLPDLDDDAAITRLIAGYRRAGFAVRARPMDRREVGELDTTWAKKLGFSGHDRRFLELVGRALPPAADAEP